MLYWALEGTAGDSIEEKTYLPLLFLIFFENKREKVVLRESTRHAILIKIV